MLLNNIRNYEVSIWTLQDGFITVLKQATLENKGQIQQPDLRIVDDGTQQFSFKIPMYLFQNGERVQNPIWYNTTNGNIMANMRKIKVIINKKDAIRQFEQEFHPQKEGIFEFLITRVTESHEEKSLYCEVECQGLAFHELGKIGYKFSLTSDDFYNQDLQWFNKSDQEQKGQQPRATLQYWNDKIFNNLQHWTYEIQMDWSGYGSGNKARDPHKVYQDSYVSSWEYNQNAESLSPRQVEISKQKERLVDLKQSNVYNLTQDLAQAFGVFCKYEYEYDDSYHIIGRKVIYYNNFLNEKLGALDLTYPYSTSSIQRSMDGTQLVTKMYVKPVDSQTSSDGYLTILHTPANKSGEDYLLNFDYLYNIGAITQQQYNQVDKYQNRISILNLQLVPLQAEIVNLKNEKITADADTTLYKNAINLDGQRITATDKLLKAITNDTGILQITAEKPVTGVLLADSSTEDSSDYYLKISQTGIIPETLHIYRTYRYTASGNDRLSDEIFGTLEYDEFNNLVKVGKLYPYLVDGNAKRTVYLTYDYKPSLYYQNIKATWTLRLQSDTRLYQAAKNKKNKIEELLQQKQSLYNEILAKKQVEIQAFETMMGPALRQGYWMPQQYNDYGDKFTSTFSEGFDTGTLISDIGQSAPGAHETDDYGNDMYAYEKTDVHGHATPIWDTVNFDGQQLSYYYTGIQQEKKNYPCIKLTEEQLQYIQQHENVNLIFYDITMNQTLSNIRSFTIGSQCQLGFLKQISTNSNNQTEQKVFPVLYVIGADNFSEQQLKILMSTGQKTGYTNFSEVINQTTLTSQERNDDGFGNITSIKETTVTNKNSQGEVISSTQTRNKTITSNSGQVKNSQVVLEKDAAGNTILTQTNQKGLNTVTKTTTTRIKVTRENQTNIQIVERQETITDAKKTVTVKGTKTTETIESNVVIKTTTTIGEDSNAVIDNRTQKAVIQTTVSSKSNKTTTTIKKTISTFNRNGNQIGQNVVIIDSQVINDSTSEVISKSHTQNNITTTVTYNGNNMITVVKNSDGSEISRENATLVVNKSSQSDQYGNVLHTDITEKTVQDNGLLKITTTTQVYNNFTKKTTIENKTISKNAYNICARLGKLTHNYTEGSTQVETTEQPGSILIKPKYNMIVSNSLQVSFTTDGINENSDWLDLNNVSKTYVDVFPRIKINSLFLKDSSNQFSLMYNNNSLTKYEDYSILSRLNSYYVTFKPQVLLQAGKYIKDSESEEYPSMINATKIVQNQLQIKPIKIYYCLSNADTAIYLDAIQVLKQSAFPQVSYEIEVNIMNPDFVKNIYNKLGYITHINDIDLKLENTFGYISEIDMKLDTPWEDEIVIKNYKTKFEDLFTKIVASSEEMRKNSYSLGLVTKAFTSSGDISASVFNSSFSKVDLNYAFNNGKLTINEKEGIWGTSESGVVAFRGGGIFTSTIKDQEGNWIWRTGITPEGINADLITTGQLDTSRIKIYAGDRLRFQLNGDGIFAYKSFVEDFNIISPDATLAIQDLQTYLNQETDGYTKAEYVKFTQNGIFLTAQRGAHVYDKTKNMYKTLASVDPITRVEVSWSGFKLRNWNNEEVFYADPDTGNLILSGTIYANAGQIGGFNISSRFLATEGKTSFLAQSAGVYLGVDGISLGNGTFSVSATGNLAAVAGNIGGWTLASNKIFSVPVDNNGNQIWSNGIVLNAYSAGGTAETEYSMWAGAYTPLGGEETREIHSVVNENGEVVYVDGVQRRPNGNFNFLLLTETNQSGEQQVITHPVVYDSNNNLVSINGKPMTNSNWGMANDRSYYYYVVDRDSQTNQILQCYIYLCNNGRLITQTSDGNTVAEVYGTIPDKVQKTTEVVLTSSPAPFRLRRDGALFIKQLHATEIWGTFAKQVTVNGVITTELEEISMGNLNAQIQKLNMLGLEATVFSDGKVILKLTQNGNRTVNFNSAGSVKVTSWAWSGNAIKVYLSNTKDFTSANVVYSVDAYANVPVYNSMGKYSKRTLYEKSGSGAKGGGGLLRDVGGENPGPGNGGDTYTEVQAYVLDPYGTQLYTKSSSTTSVYAGSYYQKRSI